MATQHQMLPHLRILLLAVSALAAHAVLCTESVAGPVAGSYQVSIGESTRLLEAELEFSRGEITAGQLFAIQQEESCKNPTVRLHDRNRVALMLQNTSSEESALTSFEIDIVELGYAFGDGDILSDGFAGMLVMPDSRSDPGVGVTATYGMTDGSTDETKLVVNFSGLAPGRAAIFRIDLDPVPMAGSFYPDYRGVLVGGNVGVGPTDPALISATFQMDGMEATTDPMPFDPGIEGMIMTSGLLEAYHAQASSEMYGQEGGFDPEEVPEPSTATLLLAGLAGLMGLYSRRRGL